MPRRINLHANTNRTTDFHSHLMEYDLPDTSGWHTVSMTTRDFEWHVVGAVQQPGQLLSPDVEPAFFVPESAVEQFVFIFKQ